MAKNNGCVCEVVKVVCRHGMAQPIKVMLENGRATIREVLPREIVCANCIEAGLLTIRLAV